MEGFRFPRTYADLESAPWCDGYDPPKGQVSTDGDWLTVFINPSWLPESWDGSPGGPSLKAALNDLRRDYWPHMQPPESFVS